jgi:predicted nucleic acid-binding protein
MLVSPSVVVVHVGEEDFRAGLEWFDRYDDKDFSFTDCVSFAVMRRLKLKVALTFDQHFKQAGFQPKP